MPPLKQARKDFYSTKDKTIVKIKYREDDDGFHVVGSVSISRRQIEDFVVSEETLQIAATELINQMILWMEQRIGSSDYGIKASVKAIEAEREHILNGDQSDLFK